MEQVHTRGLRPPQFLRAPERGAEAMQAVTAGALLPPMRATRYRKWRASGDQPSPLQRVLAMCVELHGYGVPIATLRRIPQAVTDLLDDLSTGLASPRVSAETLLAEVALESTENEAAARVMLGDRSAAALHAYADAATAEALHQLELARAARIEARRAERNA